MSPVLDRINGPADLKGLSVAELKELAAEIREELVATVTNNGGHLASNLGVVELTIALHRVFDSPRDKIVWDVGHQSYVHKLLTGRREKFGTLRQYGGLSGFTDPAESPHDAFAAGHASTSVSAALGMAMGRDILGADFQVVAVVGDGALTGGMAFEGLNQAGHLGTRLIVILNDNAMAIAPSVGALSRLLNRLRFDPRYHHAKRRAEGAIRKLPLGALVWRAGKRIEGGVKGLLMPTVIWEELGFKYLGPVDGHDIVELEATLSQARNYAFKPVFIHVVTRKGKGLALAEDDAVSFHGLPPNHAAQNGFSSYSEVLGQTVLRLMRDNPRVVAITAAMPDGTGLSIVAKEFTGRVFDVGISEQHAVTFAAGLATQGLVPIVAIYSTFLQRAYDQIIHDVCLQKLGVVFAIDRSGIVGEDGKTHQGNLDLSYLGCIPNLIVAAPGDENELQHLLYTAVRAGHPMAIRYPRGGGTGVALAPELHELVIGRGEVLRTGRDLAILAIGSMVAPSLEAAEVLAQRGVDAAVVNARFVKPLDSTLILEMAGLTGRLVTVEENVLGGGFGSTVLGLLQSLKHYRVQVERIGLPDEFIDHGPQGLLRAKYGLDAQGVAGRILAAFPALVSQRA